MTEFLSRAEGVTRTEETISRYQNLLYSEGQNRTVDHLARNSPMFS